MLSQLRLIDFRCFESLSLDLPSEGAIFMGDNAQGKTSILESICILVRLHSPRAKSMRPLSRFESNGFGVAGEGWGKSLQVRSQRGGVTLQIEGEELATQASYLDESGLIVWMGNEDVELIRSSGSGRRRYMDFICSQVDSGYRRALSRYRRALKARNLLLKEPSSDPRALQAYAEILIEHGDYLSLARGRTLRALEPLAAKAQQQISGQDEQVTLNYHSASDHDMRTALENSAQSEHRQRKTLVGPQRDDFQININGMPAVDFSSEGQQRTLALALKLAQGEAIQQQAGKLPIYLLDDIFGELDPERRNALLKYLPNQAQKLITTTNIDWMADAKEDWLCFQVSDGSVSPIEP